MPKDPLTPDACVAAIIAVMESIAGMGIVHPQRHIIRTEDDIQKYLFVEAQNRANGWFVTAAATGTSVTQRNAGHSGIGMRGGPSDFTTLRFTIEGFFQINDDEGSEVTFRNLAFNVMNEFNSYGLLAFAATVDVMEQSPADIEQLGFAIFAGVAPMHYTNISIAFRGRCHF